MDESNLEIFSDELHSPTESRDTRQPYPVIPTLSKISLSEMKDLDDGKGVTSCTLCVWSL